MKAKCLLYKFLISFLIIGCTSGTSTPYPTVGNGDLLTNTPVPTATPTETAVIQSTAAEPITGETNETLFATTKSDIFHLFNSNCRCGPGDHFARLTQIPPQNKVEVLGKDDTQARWFLIQWEKISTACWIDSSLLDYDFDPANLAISMVILPSPTPIYSSRPDKEASDGETAVGTAIGETPGGEDDGGDESKEPTSTPCKPEKNKNKCP